MQPIFLNKAPIFSQHRATENISNPLFSIIIPSWNNLALLKTCVSSLQKNSRYAHQIILHINDGSDGTLEWAGQAGLDYNWSEENMGICYAMNLARNLVNCDYIVYFNDDMYACPDWDYWLFEEVKKQSSLFYFISSTAIEPRDIGNACAIAPFDFGTSPDNFDEAALLEQFNRFEKPDWSGATWPPCVVPTILWDMIGGYSIEFSPGMYSDPDFSMKLWQAGVRSFKGVGKSRVYHFMSKSTNKLNKKRNDGRKMFLHKWGVSSNLFTRFYLRRGETWNGDLTEPKQDLPFRFKKLLNTIKRKLS
jgi:glycosyltransferase involved in cell wall biosynthesis